MENIYYSVKQVPQVGRARTWYMHDGVLPESVVHKFSHRGLTLHSTFYGITEFSNYLFYFHKNVYVTV